MVFQQCHLLAVLFHKISYIGREIMRLDLGVEVCQCVRIQRVVGVPEEVYVVRSSVEHIWALVKVGDGGVLQRSRRLIRVSEIVLQSVDSSGLAVGDISYGDVEEL